MPDTNAEAEIRGINIDKLAKGFAETIIGIKSFLRQSTTSAREIRWYSKTAGFLDSTDTTSITASQIANTSFKSRPVVVEQSWTRSTSYIRKYFVESPWISEEDIADSDIDILATNVHDLVRAVAQQVNLRCYNILSESGTAVNLNTVAITNGWEDPTNMTPIADIMNAKRLIRSFGYNPEGAILLINDVEHNYLINWLISTKGSSIPSFSSSLAQSGVVMELLGTKVVVDLNVTTDKAMMFIPNLTAAWKQFKPITSAIISEAGIGKKIRVWEEGEAILEHPKSGCLFTNVGP